MKVVVYGENLHEKTHPERMEKIHPRGMHETYADIVREIPGAEVTVVILDHIEEMTEELLDATDVLLWWGHMAHDKVPDEVVDRVHRHVLNGMGIIVLHSGHHSKIFRKLMGTTCSLRWRDGTYERMFCVNPTHPIAKGLPMAFEIGEEECYAEYFDIPAPDELIFESWFNIGEVFRSGALWNRGYGKVFYLRPGHEYNKAFYNPYYRQIIKNAVVYCAKSRDRDTLGAPPILATYEDVRSGYVTPEILKQAEELGRKAGEDYSVMRTPEARKLTDYLFHREEK
ncbi:MAG: ThuA domain-containing protein [Clostridia bacterium]|nr:ThuA domain-containing protein [Clostridia bacterium]